MRRLIRLQRKLLWVASIGTCFALTSCADEAQLTGLRVIFSSFTLPINESLNGVFSFVAALLTQTVTDGINNLLGA